MSQGMDMTHDPFDPRPDAELGQLLRAHLAADDDAAFAARVRAALATVPGPRRSTRRPSSWDVLAAWARPGLAAAAVLVLALGWWLLRAGAPGDSSLDEVLVAASAPGAALTATAQPPSTDAVLGLLLEDR
jgi:hypothetical protein